MPAELGKARHMTVDKLEPGMKVHRDVLGKGEKVLVNAGEILTRKHITQLRRWENRQKPKGPAIPKKNKKDIQERVQFGEFQGGYKVSHFNPHGILVSATIAGGDDIPEVDKNPEASPFYQKIVGSAKTSVSMDLPNLPESEIAQKRALRDEIQMLGKVNAQLGGTLHQEKPVLDALADFQTRRDALAADNESLIESLKAKKSESIIEEEDDGHDHSPASHSARPNKRRR